VSRKGLAKSTVSRSARWLVEQRIIVPLTKGTPRQYEEGPNYNQYKSIVEKDGRDSSTTNEVPLHARGVKQISKTGFVVSSLRVHHVKSRAVVEKIGDREFLRVKGSDGVIEMPFLESKAYFNNNNVKKYRAKLTVGDKRFSVELEETPRRATLYVSLPSRVLTLSELPHWKTILGGVVKEVLDFLTKWGGWKFGEVAFCKWKLHFAAERPPVSGKSLKGVTASSPSGKVWLDESEGRGEIETSEPELAQFLCSIPESIMDLYRRFRALQECSRLTADILENMMRIKARRFKRKWRRLDMACRTRLLERFRITGQTVILAAEPITTPSLTFVHWSLWAPTRMSSYTQGDKG
jgi:hypothetical protein